MPASLSDGDLVESFFTAILFVVGVYCARLATHFFLARAGRTQFTKALVPQFTLARKRLSARRPPESTIPFRREDRGIASLEVSVVFARKQAILPVYWIKFCLFVAW